MMYNYFIISINAISWFDRALFVKDWAEIYWVIQGNHLLLFRSKYAVLFLRSYADLIQTLNSILYLEAIMITIQLVLG